MKKLIVFFVSFLSLQATIAQTITQFPYSTGFETSDLDGWIQNTDDDKDWIRQSGSTQTSNTGPSSANEGNYYIYMKPACIWLGCYSPLAILTSPAMDLGVRRGGTLSFDYHMYGSDMGTLDLQFKLVSEDTWTSVWSKSGDQGNSWKNNIIDFDDSLIGSVQLRFVGTSSSGLKGDIALDNIIFSPNEFSETDIQTFSVIGQTTTATFDSPNKSVKIFIDESVDVENIVANFTIYEGASITVSSVNQISGVTSNDFTNPVTYTITSEDGLTSDNWTVTAINTSAEILAYSIPGEFSDASIDMVNHTINFYIDDQMNVSNLVSNFNLSDGASAQVSGQAQTSGVTPNDFSAPVVYTVTAEDGVTTQEWTVTANIISTQTEILAYSIPVELSEASIDSTTHSVGFYVDDQTDLSALVPSFSLSLNASADVSGQTQTSGVTPNDFTSPVVYTVTAEDGMTTQDWTVSAIVLSSSTDVLSYSIPEEIQESEVDSLDHRVSFFTEDLVDLSDLVANFSVSSGATIRKDGVIQQSGVTSNDFTNPIVYEITAEDGLTKQNWLVGRVPVPSKKTSWISSDTTTYTYDNVVIGNNTTTYNLDVVGTINANEYLINGELITFDVHPWVQSGSNISFTGGNIGFNNTNIENWSTYYNAIEGPGSSLMFGTGNSLHSNSNLYYDGFWKYKGGGAGIITALSSGEFTVWTVPSGETDEIAPISNVFKINQQGNMGFNNTDIEDWHSDWNAIEGFGAAIMTKNNGSAGNIQILDNMYYDGATRYKQTGVAGRLVLNSGRLRYFSASSGSVDSETSDNVKFTIENDGDVLVNEKNLSFNPNKGTLIVPSNPSFIEAGAIKYNSGTLEVHDGTNWNVVGDGSSPWISNSSNLEFLSGSIYTIDGSSNQWQEAYETTMSRKAFWDLAVEATDSTSLANWNYTHAKVSDSSAHWTYAYNEVVANSDDWSALSAAIDSTSLSKWNQAYDTLLNRKNLWDSAYVQRLSQVSLSGLNYDINTNSLSVSAEASTPWSLSDGFLNYSGSISALEGNSSQWQEAYTERGSQIAGNGLTWNGSQIGLGGSLSDHVEIDIDGHSMAFIDRTYLSGISMMGILSDYDPLGLAFSDQIGFGNITSSGEIAIVGASRESSEILITHASDIDGNTAFGLQLLDREGIGAIMFGVTNGAQSRVQIKPSGSVSILDNVNEAGAFYEQDYSANFTDRSLVDKGYTDSHINGKPSATIDSLNAGAGPGLSQDGMALIWSNVVGEYVLSPLDTISPWIQSGGNITFSSGNVGIGTTAIPSGFALAVSGDVLAKRIKVIAEDVNWPDYVFESRYNKMSLENLDNYIRKNKHLPGIPSAQEVQEEGIDLGSMDARLLEKIEELTLYLIELKKENEKLINRIEKLEKK